MMYIQFEAVQQGRESLQLLGRRVVFHPIKESLGVDDICSVNNMLQPLLEELLYDGYFLPQVVGAIEKQGHEVSNLLPMSGLEFGISTANLSGGRMLH